MKVTVAAAMVAVVTEMAMAMAALMSDHLRLSRATTTPSRRASLRIHLPPPFAVGRN